MRKFILLLAIGLTASASGVFAGDMSDSPADKALMESMRTMMTKMHAAPTGDADKDFVTMMLPHHQGAVDMAKVELQYGKDPMLRKLAADIIAAQEKEISMMQGWLDQHQR